MDKKYLITALIVIAVVGAGYYFYSSNRKSAAPDGSGSQVTGGDILLPNTEPAETRRVIAMDANGFSPADLTIKAGETVVFKNKDARDRWPASALHPIHQVCPDFDAKKPIKSGEEYSHTFTIAKECPFHDHLNPQLQGKITITQ